MFMDSDECVDSSTEEHVSKTVSNKNSIITLLTQKLEKYIALGDVEQAEITAGKLAKRRPDLEILTKEKDIIAENEICQLFHVWIEDIEGSADHPMVLRIPISTTVAKLKRHFLMQYGFPKAIQQWVISYRLPNDDESLLDLLNKDGPPGQSLFLYLLSSKRNQNLSLEEEQAAEATLMTMESQRQLSSHLSCEEDSIVLVNSNSIEESISFHAYDGYSSNDNMEANCEIRQISNPMPVIEGWSCFQCTYINVPTRPGCEMCDFPRPNSYRVPTPFREFELEQELLEKQQSQQMLIMKRSQRLVKHMIAADSDALMSNQLPFECLVCYDAVQPGEGAILRECLHEFCKPCLSALIEQSECPEVECPFKNNEYSCQSRLTEREIRALVPESIYQQHLSRSIRRAEAEVANSFHCCTIDCPGWVEVVDEVNFFHCQVCRIQNCLTCKAQHPQQTCLQYQEDLKLRAANDEDAKKTMAALKNMLDSNEAMKCPQCQIILQKKSGCDWLRCSVCNTEICWVTRGPRWGPLGTGDISGGCQCRVNNKICHPKCGNCH